MFETFEQTDDRAGISAWLHRGNGLRVLVHPNRTVPAATLMVTYLVGSRDEPTGLTGATHFLEHLMFKGTERHNRELGTSVFQVLQRVGGQVNASTWVDRTNYYALLPSQELERAAAIEADRMRGARLYDADVESERSVILNELDRGENEPVRRLHQLVWSTAYSMHPYRHPTIGWRGDVENMTADGLRHFYDTYYWPDNAVVSIVGDIDVAEALDLVDRHFSGIPRAPAPIPYVRAVEPEQAGPRRVTVRMAGEPGAVLVAWKSPGGLERSTDALSLLAMLLARGKSSRLYHALMDTGIAMSQSAWVSRFRDPGLFQVMAMPAPGHTHAEVEAVIRSEIERISRDGVDEAECARARRQLRADEAFSRDGPFAVAARLNEAIAAGDWRLFTDLADRVETLGAADVQEATRTYLVDRVETVGWFEPV